MAKISYLSGTNPELLDQLSAEGHELIPLSDGGDGYGKKNWALVSKFDSIDLVIAHYYQLKRTVRRSYSSLEEMFQRYDNSNTKVALIAPFEIMDKVQKELSDVGVAREMFRVTTTEELSNEVNLLLEGASRELQSI